MSYELKTITPEQAGIPSSVISEFIDKLAEKKIVLHSLLMVKDGDLLTEAYWKPIDGNFRHRMYSTSKSFVSVAIGILIGEGKLSLDDKAISFFPDKVPEDVSPLLAMTTIRDLLKMSTPYTDGCTYSPKDPDWADTFFRAKPSHHPGMIFRYDTTATTMLCMIIKRITGEDFTDYLRPRLFKPLGMTEDIKCVKTPCGYEWGGSGVLCTSRDLAKFATICLNMGKHEDQQLIPEWYMKEATSKQIDNRSTENHVEICQGYGYQFWCLRNNGFATLGMGCQVSLNLPEYGFSMVTTGDTQSLPGGYEAYLFPLFWDTIYPYLQKKEKLSENKAEYDALQNKISSLSVPTVDGELTSPVAEMVNGREYKLNENPMNISRVKFTFEGNEGVMYYTNKTGDHEIRFGFGHQVNGTFPETHYFGDYIGKPSGKGYDIITSAAWGMEDSLFIYCYAIDKYFGKIKMNIVFRENRISILMQKVAEWFFDEYNGFACGELAE